MNTPKSKLTQVGEVDPHSAQLELQLLLSKRLKDAS